MPVRKMRVEVFDESGNRYTISLEGSVTRNSALRVLDIVELLGGMPETGSEALYGEELSRFDRVRLIVEKHFPLAWFSPKDLQSTYEKDMNEKVGLSTVCTYLSRLADRGMLLKTRNSNKVLYRCLSKDIRELIKTP